MRDGTLQIRQVSMTKMLTTEKRENTVRNRRDQKILVDLRYEEVVWKCWPCLEESNFIAKANELNWSATDLMSEHKKATFTVELRDSSLDTYPRWLSGCATRFW